jgi:hypothetical protein
LGNNKFRCIWIIEDGAYIRVLAEFVAAIKTYKMLRKLFFFLIVATLFCNCSSQQDTTKTITDSITRLDMNLSAFGVEADAFPSIEAHIDFLNDSSRCEKTYYDPAFKPSMYRLTSTEIKKVFQLIRATDLNKLKTEYSVSKTDQPTSTTTIYFGQRIFVIKDYGLEGDDPLQELYKIVYKY